MVRGGGELASACARLLWLAGFPVLVLERAQPLAVRRRVAFAEAVLSGECSVEGVPGRLVAQAAGPAPGFVAVSVDPEGRSLAALRPAALVDGRMAKRNLGTDRGQARVVIGLGPGFVAGADAHAVVETQRGPELGRVLWSGAAQPDTAEPVPILGVGEPRVLRAPGPGRFEALCRIGDIVDRGSTVGSVAGAPVRAGTAGLVRGLLANGVSIEAGTKVGDVDPRGAVIDPCRLSDKARAVSAGVLEAVCAGLLRA